MTTTDHTVERDHVIILVYDPAPDCGYVFLTCIG